MSPHHLRGQYKSTNSPWSFSMTEVDWCWIISKKELNLPYINSDFSLLFWYFSKREYFFSCFLSIYKIFLLNSKWNQGASSLTSMSIAKILYTVTNSVENINNRKNLHEVESQDISKRTSSHSVLTEHTRPHINVVVYICRFNIVFLFSRTSAPTADILIVLWRRVTCKRFISWSA